MGKFILVIILNSVPQYIQVFDNRQNCYNTANLIRKAENIESYCVLSGTTSLANTTEKENIG